MLVMILFTVACKLCSFCLIGCLYFQASPAAPRPAATAKTFFRDRLFLLDFFELGIYMVRIFYFLIKMLVIR